MKQILIIVSYFFLPMILGAQVSDSSVSVLRFNKQPAPVNKLFKKSADSTGQANKATSAKPEILTSGFIDVINSGQINASARFVRVYIGEPGKFSIPLSIYSGVSANNFQSRQSFGNVPSNESLITNFINPLGGLVNFSVDGILFFPDKQNTFTRTGWLYQVGEKILTGYKVGIVTDPSTGSPVNFFNSFVSSGFYFQTGAWERSDTRNTGLSWFAVRYLLCYTNPGQLKRFMPDIKSNGIYNGYSVGWGIEISNLLNLKILFYKYIKKPEIDYSLPIYQFSFNYSIR